MALLTKIIVLQNIKNQSSMYRWEANELYTNKARYGNQRVAKTATTTTNILTTCSGKRRKLDHVSVRNGRDREWEEVEEKEEREKEKEIEEKEIEEKEGAGEEMVHSIASHTFQTYRSI